MITQNHKISARVFLGGEIIDVPKEFISFDDRGDITIRFSDWSVTAGKRKIKYELSMPVYSRDLPEETCLIECESVKKEAEIEPESMQTCSFVINWGDIQ